MNSTDLYERLQSALEMVTILTKRVQALEMALHDDGVKSIDLTREHEEREKLASLALHIDESIDPTTVVEPLTGTALVQYDAIYNPPPLDPEVSPELRDMLGEGTIFGES